MNAEMIEIVVNRVNEMKEDKEVMELISKTCKTDDEAQETLLKMAVATLVMPIEKRTINDFKK